MLAVRTTAGQGRYVAAEWDVVYATSRSTTPLLYCHGGSATALTTYASTPEHTLMRTLAQRYTVMTADLGGDVFANDTHLTRIGQALDYLAALGASGPALLVGTSMGAGGALAYALAHPERVQAVAGIIPGLDWGDIRDNNRGGVAASIDAAYSTYVDATHGPTHSPVRFADDLDAALPVALWTSADDTICTPATAAEFVTLRPQTMRTSMGNQGHSATSVTAAIDGVDAWLRGVS